MVKLLKSEHFNEEVRKAEKDLREAEGNTVLKIMAKVLILIGKLIRDIRHNQVQIMKSTGVELTTGKKSTKQQTGEINAE